MGKICPGRPVSFFTEGNINHHLSHGVFFGVSKTCDTVDGSEIR